VRLVKLKKTQLRKVAWQPGKNLGFEAFLGVSGASEPSLHLEHLVAPARELDTRALIDGVESVSESVEFRSFDEALSKLVGKVVAGPRQHSPEDAPLHLLGAGRKHHQAEEHSSLNE
jgi:hypothetical protein